VVCATTPRPFRAVGYSYRSFPQTTDEEVTATLRAAAESQHPPGPERAGGPGPPDGPR
jgi:predicted phosphoribosyltransferase